VAVFSDGVGGFLSLAGIDASHGSEFVALAVSAFVLTTLDTATRLARFAFQEVFAPKEVKKPSVLNTNRYIGTSVTVAVAAILAFSGSWKAIWPIFGVQISCLPPSPCWLCCCGSDRKISYLRS
jgi:carbon starvation protein